MVIAKTFLIDLYRLHTTLELTFWWGQNHFKQVACALYFATRVAPSRTEVFTEDRGLAIKLRARAVPTESVNACLTRGLAASSRT